MSAKSTASNKHTHRHTHTVSIGHLSIIAIRIIFASTAYSFCVHSFCGAFHGRHTVEYEHDRFMRVYQRPSYVYMRHDILTMCEENTIFRMCFFVWFSENVYFPDILANMARRKPHTYASTIFHSRAHHMTEINYKQHFFILHPCPLMFIWTVCAISKRTPSDWNKLLSEFRSKTKSLLPAKKHTQFPKIHSRSEFEVSARYSEHFDRTRSRRIEVQSHQLVTWAKPNCLSVARYI